MNAGESERIIEKESLRAKDYLLSKVERVPFGVGSIDDMLGGGIEVGVITEVYGEGGVGKTNLALMLAKTTIKLGGTCVYIDSEGLSPERFSQVFSDVDSDMLENMYIIKADTIDKLERIVVLGLKILKYSEGKKTLIIDSYGMIYRKEMGYNRSPQDILRKSYPLFNIIHKNAENYNIAVLITNQVYTDVSSDSSGSILSLGGKVLSHIARTRIEVRRLDMSPGYRVALLVKHRSRPENLKAYFRIVDNGIESISPKEIPETF
ncbi:MAG: DNA repair and recombination protein RadB [Euryarchaeota archaeon]|nr:DNA repair and recombination protein RadB [Euryarchaeota archaeon]